jgi:hypothetical protein
VRLRDASFASQNLYAHVTWRDAPIQFQQKLVVHLREIHCVFVRASYRREHSPISAGNAGSAKLPAFQHRQADRESAANATQANAIDLDDFSIRFC